MNYFPSLSAGGVRPALKRFSLNAPFNPSARTPFIRFLLHRSNLRPLFCCNRHSGSRLRQNRVVGPHTEHRWVSSAERYSANLEQIWIGPAYRFPDKVREPSNEVTQITKGNVGVLRSGFSNLIDHLESTFPVLAYVINGIAVSICCTARMSPQAAEAGMGSLFDSEGPYRSSTKGSAQALVG